MLNKYSKVLLKIISAEKLNDEEDIILVKEFKVCLRKASENRIEFFFLRTIKEKFSKLFDDLELNEIYKKGEIKIRDFEKSISFFQKEMGGIDHAIIKTYYPFPVITSDIDILFFEKTEYDSFVRKMERIGFLYEKDDDLKGSLRKTGFMKCEPHLDISWYGMRFVSKNFIKQNLVEKKNGQSAFFVSNDKATFLISAAHILFDCQYLSIRDYLVLKKFVEDKKAIAECLGEAEKFGWRDGAKYLVDTLCKVKQLVEKEGVGKRLSFPFWIPIFYMFIFFKKKYFFDFREKRQAHLSVVSIILPFVYYFWKRLRSKFSRRIYRNSWLY